MALANSVNKWVGEQLSDSSFDIIKKEKVIREAVLDTQRYSRLEINILDLPILQRLRRISQTGFTFLTYPSSTHNRFEHTLGVTTLASKFIDALGQREPDMIDERMKREVRLAGILHDVGHGPFSHLSETVYSNLPEVREAFKDPKFEKSKPHEMLSYLIVTSKNFKEFFDENMSKIPYSTLIDLQKVASMIVGKMDDSNDAFLADIINGSFDADKLDYIPRDCYFTGLKMEVDIDRIMYTISIDKKKLFGRQNLLIDISGAPFVEQILFNKMMLFTSLYHHHKVRTLECMFYAVFEACKDFGLQINEMNFNKITDFLNTTDYELLTLEGKPEEIKPLIKNIRNRNLLKRALIISKRTIIAPEPTGRPERVEDFDPSFYEFLKKMKDPSEVRMLRNKIAEEIKDDVSVYDIWVDIPKSPSFSEVMNTVIRGMDDEPVTMDKLFQVNMWLKGYAENKWKGHIFCPPQYRKKVKEIALKILQEDYQLKFNKFATMVPD